MKQAILYLRVSRDEQVRGTSLDTQEATARDLCARVGFVVAATYREEGESDAHRNPLPGAVVTLVSPDSVGSLVVRATLSGDGVRVEAVGG